MENCEDINMISGGSKYNQLRCIIEKDLEARTMRYILKISQLLASNISMKRWRKPNEREMATEQNKGHSLSEVEIFNFLLKDSDP